ncbi:MAG: polysaccharide biosynthesis/export family protein [Gemmatimonadaceae bacterium]
MALLVTISVTGAAQQRAIAPEEFHPGDRIALTVEGLSAPNAAPGQGPNMISDTAVVREGQTLRFPTIGDISLVGVRRPDLEKYLTQQFSKFVRDPVVHATPLVRVAVLGQVGRPGFYSFPSDIPLSEVVMRSGGPTGESDLNKTVVKRATKTVIGKDQIASALVNGSTLDDLRVAPGDEIVVGEKSHFNFNTILQVAGIGISLLGLLFAISRR